MKFKGHVKEVAAPEVKLDAQVVIPEEPEEEAKGHNMKEAVKV